MSTDAEMLSTNPVAGYTIRRAQEHKALVMTFQYMTSPTQKPEDANHSPNYVMTHAQAIEFAKKILESAEYQGEPEQPFFFPRQ